MRAFLIAIGTVLAGCGGGLAETASGPSCNGVRFSVGQSGEKACIKPGSGQSFRDCPDCPEMVVVPAGSFTMGSPESEAEHDRNEGPQHRVTFAKPFAVGMFSVSYSEWDACALDGGCGGDRRSYPDQADIPLTQVNWAAAQSYVAWLSRKTGQHYRLLSEAEFEYAARAGTTTPFWWGSTISTDQANYDGSSYAGGAIGENREKRVPVRFFRPNPWGLYQVHGNVYSWTEDCWNRDYGDAPSDGSARTTGNCSDRVLRGGSWKYGPGKLRATCRTGSNPASGSIVVGFRLARSLDFAS
jgi:formylglycine-generating enzyme required for sulfatase activity